jgi:LPXTG-motif cell wall-anchored protein
MRTGDDHDDREAGSTSTSTTTIATGSGETTATTGELPRTGGSSAPLAIGAVLVLLAGAALVSGSRRRRP